MLKAIYSSYKVVVSISVFLILALSCADTGKRQPKQTEMLVYHVSGLVPPDKEIVEKCRKLHVRIINEGCVMNKDFARNNRYVDSLTKAAYGMSVLEVLAQQ